MSTGSPSTRISTVRMRSGARVQTIWAQMSDSTGAGSPVRLVRSTTADAFRTVTVLRSWAPASGLRTPAASAPDGPSSTRWISAVGCASPLMSSRGSGTTRVIVGSRKKASRST